MPFTNIGRTTIRNWLAGTTATAPSYILMGSDTSSVANQTDTSLPSIAALNFISKDLSTDYEIGYEGLLLSTQATTSTIAKIGLGTETTGTAGTLYMVEDINPISHTDQFEIQTICILGVDE